jgi:hypothetical protein
MTSDDIAKVVTDIRARRVDSLVDPDFFAAALGASGQGPIIDCTAIYQSLLAKDEPVYLYEGHPSIAPPWEDACYAYVNHYGNAVVMSSRSRPFDMSKAAALPGLEPDSEAGQPWRPGNDVDWEQVRWVVNTFVWIGGRSGDRSLPTSGPAHMWQFAVYGTGAPADLHWIHVLPKHPMEMWDTAQLVLLGALNFLNCRNVTIGEPQRPRPQRRRLERAGLQIHEIQIAPMGRSTRSGRNEEPIGMVPLTSVRGHFAEYGPNYGKGLLFGKLEGRYWIPQHARGSSEFGESDHNYRLVT